MHWTRWQFFNRRCAISIIDQQIVNWHRLRKNAVFLSQQADDTFNMDPEMCQCPRPLQFICRLPLVNAGILMVAITNPTLSLTSNPLSAITTSPGSSFRRNQQCSVRNLSLTRPLWTSYRQERNSALRCDANQELDRVVVLVRQPSQRSRLQVRRNLNEDFSM